MVDLLNKHAAVLERYDAGVARDSTPSDISACAPDQSQVVMIPQLNALNRRFPRKRAFITGAASGLGLALARALAANGWALGLFDRDETRLTQVDSELSGGIAALSYPGDVTHADELTVAVNSFAATHEGLDVMINNAGVAAAGEVAETDLEDWQWVMGINFVGVLNGARAAIPHLQLGGNGLIINVSSAAAFAALPGMGAYNASKAAVLALSETLAAELKPAGIQVSVVMPTFFRTALLESMRAPAETRARAARMMAASNHSADEVAWALLQEAARGKLHVVFPRSARWLWRLKRWAPGLYLKCIERIRAATGHQPAFDNQGDDSDLQA
jgi:NAD(P)-dependent dehydrogenase (short-subunit alcohol dehydrogenase family)